MTQKDNTTEQYTYRIKFTKGEEVKFIGHLDILRLFQRANRRAGLPMAYSQGFNPHQIMSFASPLTLGTTSCGEYGDFVLQEKMEPSDIMAKLNAVLPKGVQIVDVVLILGKTENAMASIDGASYELYPDSQLTSALLDEKLSGYLSQDTIVVRKKTKKKEEEADIRQDIYQLENRSENGEVKLFLFCASGSRRNLKPEYVMSSLYGFLGLEFHRFDIGYHRLELYRTEQGKLVPLAEGIGTRTCKEDDF